jgi:hypothetical protein
VQPPPILYFSKKLQIHRKPFAGLILLLFLAANAGLRGQSKSEKLADSLLRIFPDQPAVFKKWTQSIDFSPEGGKTNVTVDVKDRIELLSMSTSSYYDHYVYYDYFSEIKSFHGAGIGNASYLIDKQRYCGNAYSDFAFYDDNKFCRQTLPLSYHGQEWEYSISKEYKNSRYFTVVDFVEDLPCLQKKIIITIPDNIEVALQEFNFEGYGIVKNTESYSGGKKIIYYVENLAHSKANDNDPGFYRSQPFIMVFVKSVMRGTEKTALLSNTGDLYKWYHQLTSELKPQRDTLKPFVDALLKDKKTDEEKVKAIYYWVHENIHYIAFEYGLAGFKPEEAHNVFKYRYGDCKGMANLLCEMLKIAGYDARLTWIGTREIPFTYATASLAVDNHLICSVTLNNKRLFLDGTESVAAFGENAERIQGKQVMIENGDAYIIDSVPADPVSKNLKQFVVNSGIEGKNLSGKVTGTAVGEVKRNLLYSFYPEPAPQRRVIAEKFISADIPLRYEGFTCSNYSDKEKDIVAGVDFSSSLPLNFIGDEIYIDLNLYKRYNNLFIPEERTIDFDMDEKRHYVFEHVFSIPAGYSVSYLPPKLQVGSDEFDINYLVEKKENNLYLKVSVSLKTGFITKKNFKKWNQAMEQLSERYSSSVVIKK